MFGQIAKASSSHHNQEKRSQNVCPEIRGFCVQLKDFNMLLGCTLKTKRLRKHTDMNHFHYFRG